ncbi:hypothetical protein A8B78_12080 [Jannaschia sp. EhC01]|nr:hypothetical protein A8B78_12080 [Jannaschia sp. EhC01]
MGRNRLRASQSWRYCTIPAVVASKSVVLMTVNAEAGSAFAGHSDRKNCGPPDLLNVVVPVISYCASNHSVSRKVVA